MEKFLAQRLGQATLIAISQVIEQRKKEYYRALEPCNRSLNANSWVSFFSQILVQAQKESMQLIDFLVRKRRLLQAVEGQINSRQEKVLLRMLAEGRGDFKGGLSAENYLSITKASRATVTRDLSDLVEKGALTKTGSLRHTRYWLNL